MNFGSLFPGVGMFKSYLHPERGYEKAQDQMNQFYNQAQGHLAPYAQQGQAAYGPLSGAMESLLNPAQLRDRFANEYQMSDMAKMDQSSARDSTLAALSSMGLMGSTPGLQAMQAGENHIAAQDKKRFFDDMINQYVQGAGLAQGIYGQGGQMASMLGQNAMNMGGVSGDNAYNRQNAPGHMFSDLLGKAISVGGGMMGVHEWL